MEDEVFEMDQFAVDPQGGASVGELAALDKAVPDRRAGDALVETRECDTGVAFTLLFQFRKCHASVRFSR
jgi:hypothetical protein